MFSTASHSAAGGLVLVGDWSHTATAAPSDVKTLRKPPAGAYRVGDHHRRGTAQRDRGCQDF